MLFVRVLSWIDCLLRSSRKNQEVADLFHKKTSKKFAYSLKCGVVHFDH